MTTAPVKKIRQMPKGGRKGGSSFPRVSLVDALTYSKKLVTKTHSGAQPQDVIFSGVVGAKSGTGNVRIAALKQYGLIRGDAKLYYLAADLAKRIHSAPEEELLALYQIAALHASIFKKIFDAFLGDTVSKAKLKQRAADLNVHPDETASCVDLYVSSLTTAGLVTSDGDNVTHVASLDASVKDVGELKESDESGEVSNEEAGEDENEAATQFGIPIGGESPSKNFITDVSVKSPRAVFNVNITLDSSLDIEKLQKQLDILRRFGAI